MLASGAKDNKIRLWTPSGACLALGDGHAGAVSALAFSRKSASFLVSGGVDKILKVGAFEWMPLSLTAHHTLPSMIQPGSSGSLPMPSIFVAQTCCGAMHLNAACSRDNLESLGP